MTTPYGRGKGQGRRGYDLQCVRLRAVALIFEEGRKGLDGYWEGKGMEWNGME